MRNFLTLSILILLSVCLSGHQVIDNPDKPTNPNHGRVLQLEEVKGFDTGLILGGGVGIPLGRYEVTYEGQYSLGLMSIGPMIMEGVPPETPSFGEDVKHRGFSISAGFGFQI